MGMAKKIIIIGENKRAKQFYDLHMNFDLHAMHLIPSQINDFELTAEAMVVEIGSEDNNSKLEILNSIGRKNKPDTIVLSEISTISATRAGSAANLSENLVGFCMAKGIERSFVELVQGEKTPKRIIRDAADYFKTLNFETIITKDSPGIILNRLLASMINEAIYVYMYGLARMEDIDEMMKLGANFPMGPFEYADFLGLDRVLKTLEWLTEELGPQYRPCPLLRRKVEAGLLGKKAGRGFYEYGI
jgi:3-hydroxybutyryl-CoA dehydrogenase